MGEIRKDYFLDRYVIISPERAKRPHDFVVHPMEPVKSTPFTPGNESMMPPLLVEEPKGKDWLVRVIPNKFAIVRPEGQPSFSTDKLYTWAGNYGQHEIVIEGQRDGVSFAELTTEHVATALNVAFARVAHLAKEKHIKSVTLFKNERPEAGASINHPHSQIVALAVVPKEQQDHYALHEQLRKEFGFSCLYKILDFERGSSRIVAESEHFVALCPYASRFAMEVLIVPIRDSHSYLTLSEVERADLANVLHPILKKLSSIGAPFNVEWFHSIEPNGFHWHLSITPRMNVWAGFEYTTGIIVNPTPPEDAAAFYRS